MDIPCTFITTLLARTWHRLTVLLPSRSFWRLNPTEEVRFAVSLRRLLRPDGEHTLCIPPGDAQAYGEIAAFLKHLYPKINIKLHHHPEQPLGPDAWKQTVVLIGGGENNLTYRYLEHALEPELTGHELKFMREGKRITKGFYCRRCSKSVLEPKERDIEDVAVVIRAPNPYQADKHVFMFVGAYSHGTYGAAYWATRQKNLFWLWRCRICEGLLRWKTNDSTQVALRVPVIGQVLDAQIPDIGAPNAWNHDYRSRGAWRMRKRNRPYFFRTPENYGCSYQSNVVKDVAR